MKEELSKIVNAFHKKIKRNVISVYDGGNKYLLYTEPKESSNNYDPCYTMKKDFSDIRGFNPVTDMKFYEKALQNPVYEKYTEEELEAKRKKSNDEFCDELLRLIESEE